eukprot:3286591-Alexandrium_andersonii.AAC.1
MSASLVGSEMCIRDRIRGLLRLYYEHAVCKSLLRASGIVVQARRLNAVSYTHLTLPTICSV